MLHALQAQLEPARVELVREFASKAIALDPQLAEPHVALGLVAEGQRHYPEARGHFTRALENGSPLVLSWGAYHGLELFFVRIATVGQWDLHGTIDNSATPIDKLAEDGVLTFDKLTSVYSSGTLHEEDQPCHLVVTQPDLCSTRCVEEFGNPCQHFCPAAVYEMEPKAGSKHGIDLKINASNCVHCKTCDIMDPYQVINWVTPEGGGGPNYTNL